MRRSTSFSLGLILLLALGSSLNAQQNPSAPLSGLAKGAGPAPAVEFVDLQAVQVDRVAKLVWRVQGEVNNKYFELERSTDGKDWTIVTTLPGGLDAQSITTYSATDPSPKRGTNYYRVRQVDFDGAASYSPTIAHSTVVERMTAFPNPATGPLQVVGPQTPSYALYGADGQVHAVNWQEIGLGHHAADLSALPAGRYLLTEQSSGQKLLVLKP